MLAKTEYQRGLRKAIISEGTCFVKDKYVVNYYYDGFVDHEAIRGNGGVGIYDTIKQAQRNAKVLCQKK